MTFSIDDVEIFCEGLDHPECVAVHPDGSVWAGGEAGQIYRISEDGRRTEIVANTGGFILGIAFSPDLSWLAICDNGKKCVWKLVLETMALEVFVTGAGGNTFGIPNYAVFDDEGNLYVSDSGNFLEVNGRIFKFDQQGKGEVWHAGPLNFANGMVLSADGRSLFVACTWLPGVEKISINEDGSAGERMVYATLPQTCPDGLALDAEGNLYVSCYAPNAIFRVSTIQEVHKLIDDWEAHTLSNPTNIAFGGPDARDLFVAGLGRWHIAKIKTNVRGQRLACFQGSSTQDK